MALAATMWDWFYVFAPFQIYLTIVVILVCYGDHGDERNFLKQFFRRISNSLEKSTGYAGWAMAGALSGLLMLGTAAIGLYWDVGYHINFGRDQQLFTPSHTMIVLGLGGLVYSALIAVIFATLDDAPVGFRFGALRVPWSAVALAAMGFGGVGAFPIDALWHEAYGIDVTLWSPSHLQLVLGGSLATIVLWLMLKEGSPARPTMLGRTIVVTIFGAVLTGVSTVQGEFDFGVPQFQVLYLPLLVATAAGFALVFARLALGPWGACKAVLAFLVIRGVIGLLVAGPFNETFPNFPLYVVAALAVDGTALLLGTEGRLRFALVAGALVGTVGVAADLAWLSALADVQPTTAGLPMAALLSPIAGVAAALLGGALVRSRADGAVPVPAAAALVGGLVLAGVLAYPLPRNVGDVDAVIRLRPEPSAGVQRATVEVELVPADAAERATGFGVVAWQGGGRVAASLEEVGPGRYVSSRPLPVGGTWKTVVGLQRSDEVMAAPVYLPADPEIGAPEIPALPERRASFVRNTVLLLRETHAGDPGVATLAYTGLGLVALTWIGLFSWCAVRVGDNDDTPAARPPYSWWSPPPAPPQAPQAPMPVGTWGERGWGGS